MLWRAVKSVAVVTACWAVVEHLHDVARYLRTRDLSNPNRLPGATRPR